MDNLENPISSPADTNDLRAEYDALRGVVVSALVLLVVFTMSFNLYLLRQVRFTRAELAMIRPQAAQIIAEYQAGSARAMDEFVRKIAEYGQAHPDFAPILAKYGIRPAAATPSVAPALTSPPPAAAKTKK
jgi:hypothetical protein